MNPYGFCNEIDSVAELKLKIKRDQLNQRKKS